MRLRTPWDRRNGTVETDEGETSLGPDIRGHNGSLIGVSLEQGVLNQFWAAKSKDVVSEGYYVPLGKNAEGSSDGRDKVLAARL